MIFFFVLPKDNEFQCFRFDGFDNRCYNRMSFSEKDFIIDLKNNRNTKDSSINKRDDLLEVIDHRYVIDDHVQIMNQIEYHKQKQLISLDHDVRSAKGQEVH